jgi:hypothetical protein
MKQTAVEWLVYVVQSNIAPNYIPKEIVEQAKEMEKEQMKDASCPYVGGWEDDDFEYWYNQTYKSEQ